jgi:hypothetical protein
MGIRSHQDDVSDEPIIQDRAPPDRRDRARTDEPSHHLDITLRLSFQLPQQFEPLGRLNQMIGPAGIPYTRH